MYLPKHFKTQELVPPEVYNRLNEKALTMMDDRVLITLDQLREQFGPTTVNDWCFGGHYQQSGLRTTDCEHYSPTSQHTFGRAADCKFHDLDAETVRKEIIKNKLSFPHITFMEDGTHWLHFDVRNCTPIMVWNPETNKLWMV
ncbi:hypothetical protein CI610_01376 [invertebrate metagenome]|uniref:Peptidase M15A C-terminal domain-containing protein n=1 Tax=invertebrate metagenome TaxID=1711999 RepID=A0A2H9T8V4_9ZZZZ